MKVGERKLIFAAKKLVSSSDVVEDLDSLKMVCRSFVIDSDFPEEDDLSCFDLVKR